MFVHTMEVHKLLLREAILAWIKTSAHQIDCAELLPTHGLNHNFQRLNFLKPRELFLELLVSWKSRAGVAPQLS